MTKAIEEYKRFTSDGKMMLSKEREEGIKDEKYLIAKTLKQMNMNHE